MLKLFFGDHLTAIKEPVKAFFLIGINVSDSEWTPSLTLFLSVCMDGWMYIQDVLHGGMYVQLALFISTCTKSKTDASTY